MLRCVWLFATLWPVACQASLSMGFSRQEYRSGLPFPSPGDIPGPGIKPLFPLSPAFQADSLLSHQGSRLLQGISPIRDWTYIFCTLGKFFTAEPLGKPYIHICLSNYLPIYKHTHNTKNILNHKNKFCHLHHHGCI